MVAAHRGHSITCQQRWSWPTVGTDIVLVYHRGSGPPWALVLLVYPGGSGPSWAPVLLVNHRGAAHRGRWPIMGTGHVLVLGDHCTCATMRVLSQLDATTPGGWCSCIPGGDGPPFDYHRGSGPPWAPIMARGNGDIGSSGMCTLVPGGAGLNLPAISLALQ